MTRPIQVDQARSVLSARDVDVADYAGRYANLQERLGVDFSFILRSMNYVPPCVAADRHRNVRAEIAELIGEGQAGLKAELPALVADALCCLRQEGEHDLLGGGLVPLVQEVLGRLSGLSLSRQRENSLISHLFSQSIGIARRRRMEDEYRELWEAIADAHPHEPEPRRGARLALVILGFDATVGTLACSLYELISAAPGLMGRLPFAKWPVATGVPYVDRRATADFALNGQEFASGESLRVNLDGGGEGHPHRDPALLFGAGAHSCLGRSLALSLWSAVGHGVRAMPGSIRVVDYGLSKNDVFRIPDRFQVRVFK